jgi:hypothetical protein
VRTVLPYKNLAVAAQLALLSASHSTKADQASRSMNTTVTPVLLGASYQGFVSSSLVSIRGKYL